MYRIPFFTLSMMVFLLYLESLWYLWPMNASLWVSFRFSRFTFRFRFTCICDIICDMIRAYYFIIVYLRMFSSEISQRYNVATWETCFEKSKVFNDFNSMISVNQEIGTCGGGSKAYDVFEGQGEYNFNEEEWHYGGQNVISSLYCWIV